MRQFDYGKIFKTEDLKVTARTELFSDFPYPYTEPASWVWSVTCTAAQGPVLSKSPLLVTLCCTILKF